MKMGLEGCSSTTVIIVIIHNILQEKQEENELRALPPPSPAQITALSFTLMEAAKEQGISDYDFRIRQEIVCSMEKIIQQPLPGNQWGFNLFSLRLKKGKICIYNQCNLHVFNSYVNKNAVLKCCRIGMVVVRIPNVYCR